MRRLFYCDNTQGGLLRFENFADDYLVQTATGFVRADQLSGATKATITIGGQDANGGVVYTARHGGPAGNLLRVTHDAGETGVEHLARDLAVTMADNQLTVTFGTDGTGNTLVPTAQEIVDEIGADPEIAECVTAAVTGTGAGLANLAPQLPLIGGLDNGDWRKFNEVGGSCRRINTVEVI